MLNKSYYERAFKMQQGGANYVNKHTVFFSISVFLLSIGFLCLDLLLGLALAFIIVAFILSIVGFVNYFKYKRNREVFMSSLDSKFNYFRCTVILKKIDGYDTANDILLVKLSNYDDEYAIVRVTEEDYRRVKENDKIIIFVWEDLKILKIPEEIKEGNSNIFRAITEDEDKVKYYKSIGFSDRDLRKYSKDIRTSCKVDKLYCWLISNMVDCIYAIVDEIEGNDADQRILTGVSDKVLRKGARKLSFIAWFFIIQFAFLFVCCVIRIIMKSI